MAPLPGAEKKRQADHYVFAWCEAESPTLDLSAWRFMLVPTDALANGSCVRSTKLVRLGYAVLTADGLRRRT